MSAHDTFVILVFVRVVLVGQILIRFVKVCAAVNCAGRNAEFFCYRMKVTPGIRELAHEMHMGLFQRAYFMGKRQIGM